MNEMVVHNGQEFRQSTDAAGRLTLPTQMSDQEAVEYLIDTKSHRELAEYIVRREAAWREAARKRQRPLPERIGAKLEYQSDTGCWVWTGATNGSGYGMIGVGQRKKYVHRATYEIARGPIPDGLMIDHLCRNPICCRPDHLEAVTNRENTLRGKVSALRHLRKAA